MARWDGHQWSKVGSYDREILNISGSQRSDVYFAGSDPLRHWDGTSLETVVLPAAANYSGTAVVAVSPNEAWLSNGRTGVHLAAGAWQEFTLPLGYPSGMDIGQQMAATNPADVWLVGWEWPAGHPGTAAYHWDGQAWTVRLSLDLGMTNWHPNAVWASGPADVWLAGYGDRAYHWNGAQFDTVETATPHDGYSRHIWGSANNDVWFVGAGGSSGRTPDVIHWDGASLSRVDVGASDATNAVWGFSCEDVWIGTADGDLLHHGW